MNAEQRRWVALCERHLNGLPLSEAERAEFEHLSAAEPARQHELAMYRQLSELECQLADNDAAIVAGALSAVNARDKVIPLRRPEARDRPALPLRPERGALPPERLDGSRARRFGGPLAWASAGAGLVLAAAALLWSMRVTEPELPAVAAGQRPEAPAEAPAAVELTFTSGQVFVDGRPTLVTASALQPRSTLAVGKAGRACIAIDTHTDACLDAESSIVLDDQQGPRRSLRLLQGRVVAVLDKRPAEQRFSVISGSLSATALGTAFAVERAESGHSNVTVMQGRVEVSIAEGAKRLVSAHEQLEATGQHFVGEPERTTRAEQLRHWSLVDTRELWKKAEVAILHVDTQPAQAMVTLNGRPLGAAPLSLLAGTGLHQLELELEGFRTERHELTLTPGQEKRMRVPLVPEHESLPTATAAAAGRPANDSAKPSASAAELLARARDLVKQGQWQGAVAAYQRLRQSYPKSPESHTVLVALGQLELDRLGQPASALASFDRYLAYGGGLTQEARFGRIRALRALGRVDSEAQAIREYLRHYPASADAGSLKRRLARLDRR